MQISAIFYVYVLKVRSPFPILEKIDAFLLYRAHKSIAKTAHAEAEKTLVKPFFSEYGGYYGIVA